MARLLSSGIVRPLGGFGLPSSVAVIVRDGKGFVPPPLFSFDAD